ncbi:PH domain-containing protein [Streptomyces sp. PTM05]|uniref:PH domain-containing protein n=1 Tax=Streptantibioticus parmotrematis TaxID=2873249 RepID=A0ABS7QLA3_9ACTN|nr:PH domain-containing protein [Streptantibioticus parmotrematis]MBY8883972.1 PH domain-containing protein [Streptantibioticus parmotrematis]
MTSQYPSPSPNRRSGADGSAYADRAFRSPMGVVGGVLLLALGLWLVIDAMLHGSGRTPWLALAVLVLGAPLVYAFTLRPVVYAGEARMLVRNPFRTITIPWAAVEAVRSGYTSEVLAGGRKFQLWSVPVSMRARKRASRQAMRAAAGVETGSAPSRGPAFGRGGTTATDGPPRAQSDQVIDQLNDLAERNAPKDAAKGEVAVRWAYEVIAPAVVGAIATVVLAAS